MLAEIEQHLPEHLWSYVLVMTAPGKGEPLATANEEQFLHCLTEYLRLTIEWELDRILTTIATYVNDGQGRVELYDDCMICFRPATQLEMGLEAVPARLLA